MSALAQVPHKQSPVPVRRFCGQCDQELPNHAVSCPEQQAIKDRQQLCSRPLVHIRVIPGHYHARYGVSGRGSE